MKPRDTDQAAHEVQLAVYRRVGPEGRVRLAVQMSEDVRTLTRTAIRHRHSEYTDQEVEWALFRLILGDQLFRAAWPDQPVLDP